MTLTPLNLVQGEGISTPVMPSDITNLETLLPEEFLNDPIFDYEIDRIDNSEYGRYWSIKNLLISLGVDY